MATMEGLMQKRLVVWIVLLFCTVVSQNAWAKSDLGMKAIGGDFGFVDPDNVDGTVGFGLFANMGTLAPDWRLAPHIGYWSKSEEFGGDKVSISDISFATRADYMFHVSSRKFQPYASGGLGLHFVKAKVEMTSPAMEASETETKVGVDFGGGFLTPISDNTDFCFDLMYTAVSDVAHISMKAGVSFDLGGGGSSQPEPQKRQVRKRTVRH
jgi:hypothetical protein